LAPSLFLAKIGCKPELKMYGYETQALVACDYMLPRSSVSYSFQCDMLMLITLALLTSCKY
jgi:hypothetical protein